MNGRGAAPLSPISTGGGSEKGWTGGLQKLQTSDTESQYSPITRGQLASPPISSGSSSTMNGFESRAGGGFQRPASGRTSTSNGPSPPASVARSSNGASLYNGSTMYGSESGGKRGGKDEQFEAILSEHYIALRRYLASSLRDEKGNPRPNKARDKLLRLSAVQFQELSTDVFDELLRRQQAGRRPNNGESSDSTPPPFLLPKDTFHPKRNQARQKLSTLPPPRFRDLATDVFYELERRFPKFLDSDINRAGSPASFRGPNRSMTSTPNDPMRGPGGPRMRRPSEASSVGQYPRSDSRQGGPRPMMNGMNGGGLGVPGSPGMAPNDYGRPLAKALGGNTIIPTKSTMVEDSDAADDDEDEDAFGLENAARGRDSKSSIGAGAASEADKKIIADYQVQVAEMRDRIEGLEESLKLKDEALHDSLEGERQRSTTASAKEQEFSDLRLKLEEQLVEALNLNQSMQSELDRVRAEHNSTSRELEDMRVSGGARRSQSNNDHDLEQENEVLRQELKEQAEISNDVRREAEEFLREMRVLTESSGSSWEREEQLNQHIIGLEDEVKDWRNRYARTKTQLRSLRASSIGLSIHTPNAGKYAQGSEFAQDDGLVKDVHVTKFQISIDELLQIARHDNTDRVIEYMKNVVVAVRNITQDLDTSSDGDLSPQQNKLKARVSATANNIITASKNYASAKGLSPVSLLDAAASHLTAAVVELVRTVKIRPTPAGELEDDDDGSLPVTDPTGFFPQHQEGEVKPILGLGHRNRDSYVSSIYSPVNSPRQSTASRPRSSQGEWNGRPMSSGRGINGRPVSRGLGQNGRSSLTPAPLGFGNRSLVESNDVEDLKIYLEDQTALLVQTIQSLVGSIRSDSGISDITTELEAIASVVNKVVLQTNNTISQTHSAGLKSQTAQIVARLADCKIKLEGKTVEGKNLMDPENEGNSEELAALWRAWNQSLPPLAFEVARETKELVQRVDSVVEGRVADDFS